MEFFLEILLPVIQFFAELLIEIASALTSEFGVHRAPRPTRYVEPSPWGALAGYTLLGIVAGALSLLLFPNLFVPSTGLRWMNLVLTPLVAGILMGMIGARRRRQGQDTIRLESFLYGWIFAFAMAAVRFGWGH